MRANFDKNEVMKINEKLKNLLFKDIEKSINTVIKRQNKIERPDKVIESLKKIRKIIDRILREDADEIEEQVRKKMEEQGTGNQQTRMEMAARDMCKVGFFDLIWEYWRYPKDGVELNTIYARREFIREILHCPFSLDDILMMLQPQKKEPTRGKIYIDF